MQENYSQYLGQNPIPVGTVCHEETLGDYASYTHLQEGTPELGGRLWCDYKMLSTLSCFLVPFLFFFLFLPPLPLLPPAPAKAACAFCALLRLLAPTLLPNNAVPSLPCCRSTLTSCACPLWLSTSSTPARVGGEVWEAMLMWRDVA